MASANGHVDPNGEEGGENPNEIFLDDDDIAEIKEMLEQEGDFPMDEDNANDDDVEEVDEMVDDREGGAQEDNDEDYEDEEDDEGISSLPDTSLRQFTHHNSAIFTLATHPISPILVVSGGEDDNGYLWRLDTGEEVAKLSGHTDSVVTAGWSCDGEMVATGGMDGRVRVWRRTRQENAWEWARWEFLTVLEGMDEITWLDWHPKGAVLVCGTGDGTVWMWQLPSGRNMNVFSGHTASVTCGRFLPDGKRLITGSEDSSLIVWDPKTSTPVHKLSSSDGRFRFDGGVTTLAVNGPGTAAIVGGVDGAIRIVSLANGQVVSSLESHEEGSSVEAVQWSQGTAGSAGLWITAGTDKKVKVFEASNGSVRWSASHDDAVTSLALPPSGLLLITGSVDRTAKVWDLRTGALKATSSGHRDVIHAVAASNHGKWLVSASDDGTAKVFEIPA